jgi:hypothetical protein
MSASDKDRIFPRHNSFSVQHHQSYGQIVGQESGPLKADPSLQPLQNSALQSLLNRVDMNSAFLNLAKNDEELINDIKSAIINLHNHCQKREMLYLAIEHNTRHLCTIT